MDPARAEPSPAPSPCACGAVPDDDAAYCDQCAWPVESRPAARTDAFHLAWLTLAVTASAFLADTETAGRTGAAVIGGWESRRANAALVEEARASDLGYVEAAASPGRHAGRLVLWYVTPAAPGRLFHRGDSNEPIRVTSGKIPDMSGKSVPSYRMLARLEPDGSPGVAVSVIELR